MTSSTFTVPASTTPVQLAGADGNREGLSVVNNGTGSLFIGYTQDVSPSLFACKLEPGDYWELPYPETFFGKGAIYGVWDAPGGEAMVTPYGTS